MRNIDMSLVSRERALETKVTLLEQRLILVERFVEMRFCESFRDFTIRNGSNSKVERRSGHSTKKGVKTRQPSLLDSFEDEENRDNDDDYEQESSKPTRTRSGRSTRKPARLSSSITQSPTSRRCKEVKQQVTRKENCQEKHIGGSSRGSKRATASLQSTTPEIKSDPLSDDDEQLGEEGDDTDYFTFPYDENVSEVINTNTTKREHRQQASQKDSNWNEDSNGNDMSLDGGSPKPKRRRKSITVTPKKRAPYATRKNSSFVKSTPTSKLILANSMREECSVCHKYFRKELMPSHMEFHTKERHLKCSFCEKTFFNRSMVIKHEKLHQPEKYAKKCRLCDKTTIESGKMLVHERSCIRRALEQNKRVDPALLEEIRRRSIGMDLKWPDQSENKNDDSNSKMKKCSYCSKSIPMYDYQSHVKMHATWVCTVCNNSYINKEGLVKHMRNIHGANEDASDTPSEQELEANIDNKKPENETGKTNTTIESVEPEAPPVPDDSKIDETDSQLQLGQTIEIETSDIPEELLQSGEGTTTIFITTTTTE